jgi:hypothetical protein
VGDESSAQLWQALPPSALAQLDEDGQLAYEMGELAQQIAQEKLPGGIQLDFTPDSIQVLERMLTALYDNLPRGWWARLRRRQPSEEQIWRLSIPFGAYLGETIRRNLGGKWACHVSAYPGDKAQYMVLTGGSVIAPISKVFKRLADGPADEVSAYYYMIRTLDEQARANKLGAG